MPNALYLAVWKTLSAQAQESVARRVAGILPEPFRFIGIQSFAMGDQSCPMALFDYSGSTFSLIPGASVTLGYDLAHPFQPTPAQTDSWKATAEEYSLDLSLHDYLAQITTPLRTVQLKPFLLEAFAANYNWKMHEQVIQSVGAEGFRLPTSDEWEYACSAGSRTLFRWGNDCPTDHYPTDPSAWDMHRRPNAFGLFIAMDPYKVEAVLEPEVLYRGGDGGGAICGGSGFLTGWLTLASAYVDQNAGYWQGKSIPSLQARRAFSVSDQRING